MAFRRALRILAARWWIIALGALLGAVAAVIAAGMYNDRIVPDYEASATVQYLRLEGESEGAFEARLADARSVAVDLTDQPSQRVTADDATGTLTFTMTGSDPDRLVGEVERLREEFLAIDPGQEGFEEAATAELARLQSEIDQVREQLRERQPAAPQLDPSTVAEREQLSFEINSLRQEIASLRIQLAFPELAASDPETLQAQLDRSQELLVRLTEARDALPSEGSTTETTASLDTLVLQRHLQDLEARYVSFSLTLLEQPDVIGPISAGFAIDRTQSEIGRTLAAAAGLLAGALVAAAAVLVVDRVREPVLTPGDLEPIKAVAMIDRARPGEGRRPWYPRAGPAERRRQIQTFRAAIDPVVAEGATSLGLVGVSAPQHDVQALAADLAASVAASGRRVLLVDAAFGSPTDLAEYGDESPTLAELISNGDTLEAAETIKRALTERDEILPDLLALPAGSAMEDATDALAGPRFRILLGTAAELDELVIVAAAPFGDPSTEVLTQRLDHVLLVGRTHHTTRQEILDAARDLEGRSAMLVGVALLRGRHARKKRSGRAILAGFRGYGRHRKRGDEPEEPPSEEVDERADQGPEPTDALESVIDATVAEMADDLEPAPGDDEPPEAPEHVEPDSPSTSTNAMAEPVESPAPTVERVPEPDPTPAPPPKGRHQRPVTEKVGPALDLEADVDTDDGIEVVIDVRDVTQAERDTAERYLVSKVVEMIEARDALASSAESQHGMALLTPEEEQFDPSIGLARVLVSDQRARSWDLDRGLTAVLGGELTADRLRDWLRTRFFVVQSEMFERGPRVWHLSSSEGTFQALVRAETFDTDRIDVLRERGVGPTIARLRRDLVEAGKAGDLDEVERAQSLFDEVRDFDRQLFELRRRGWAVRGDLDRAAKLAVLQNEGVVRRLPSSVPESP